MVRQGEVGGRSGCAGEFVTHFEAWLALDAADAPTDFRRGACKQEGSGSSVREAWEAVAACGWGAGSASCTVWAERREGRLAAEQVSWPRLAQGSAETRR